LGWIIFAPRSVAPGRLVLAGSLRWFRHGFALCGDGAICRKERSGCSSRCCWCGCGISVHILPVADMAHTDLHRMFPGLKMGMECSGLALRTWRCAGEAWLGRHCGRFCRWSGVVRFLDVGDLTESRLTTTSREFKDAGTLFPGHGGVMDRIDSVTGAAPVRFFGIDQVWE